MATIEERATKFAEQKCHCAECHFPECPKCDKYNKYVALYKEIALQQRERDIDKACEEITKIIRHNNFLFLANLVPDPEGVDPAVQIEIFRKNMLKD